MRNYKLLSFEDLCKLELLKISCKYKSDTLPTRVKNLYVHRESPFCTRNSRSPFSNKHGSVRVLVWSKRGNYFINLGPRHYTVRSNLDTHLSDTPFTIRQPIRRPCLLEGVYKPIRSPHWCRVLPLRALEIGCK